MKNLQWVALLACAMVLGVVSPALAQRASRVQ